MKFINIGFGNMVSAGRIVAIACPDSAPVKRLVQDAKDEGRVIDAVTGSAEYAGGLRRKASFIRRKSQGRKR